MTKNWARNMNKVVLPTKRFQCGNCGYIIKIPQGVPKPTNCPRCGASASMIHRLEQGPPSGRRGSGGPRWQRAPLQFPPFRPRIQV